MSLLPKSIHRCHRYPTKFNSGRDIPNIGEVLVAVALRSNAMRSRCCVMNPSYHMLLG